jgi:hypothetical protein
VCVSTNLDLFLDTSFDLFFILTDWRNFVTAVSNTCLSGHAWQVSSIYDMLGVCRATDTHSNDVKGKAVPLRATKAREGEEI